MSVTPRLELRQSQSLVMTPRLQQSLKMLRMSNLELAEHVAGIVEANPLLEAARPPERPIPAPPAGRAGAEGTVSAIDLATATVTLAEHLRTQVRLAHAEPPALAAALAVIEELDPDGYFRSDADEVALRHGLSRAALDAGLALVQECEPAGVGARGLAECLKLQLRDRGLLDPPLEALLAGLDLVAAGRTAELAARCGVSPQAIPEMLGVLRGLDPKPGASFAEEAVSVVVPDVFVRRTSSGWDVELNTETLPRVLVNNVYAQKLNTRDGAALAYISECRAQAGWLVRSLEQRARTILAVAGALVEHQEHFFASGISGMRPLSQRMLAEKLGLHESTVSRVTAGKYLACERGTFDMHFFFSQAIPTSGGEAVSAAAVQDRIRSLIQQESPARTLSDDGIVVILQREGIDIARRTVAKYRDGMGIPSSVARRRLKSAGATR
jgi:RNA polymerase sigma-54 factor